MAWASYPYEGQVVLITGAGSGIGQAIARAFLDQGASVVLTGRRVEPLEETAAGFDPERFLTLAGDMSSVEDIERIVAIVDEYEAVGVIVGLPRTLSNTEGAAVKAARGFARALGRALDERPDASAAPIEFYDERLTTVTATQALRASGVKAKDARAVVDQAAAVAILQGWLDGRR